MAKRGDWLKLYLEYVENTEPPILYKEWVAISAIASVLKRKTWLDWGLDSRIFPNMYIVLVGPPGRCRKGTAMAPAALLIRKIGVKMSASSITREALIKELEESSALDDINGDIVVHSSLTVNSPELTVFLGQDNKEMLMTLTDWYDCAGEWEYRTKTQGTNTVTGVWVNLLGATTPHLIQNALPLDAVGGGLASRMVFVYEDRIGKRVPAPFLTQLQKDQAEQLLNELTDISKLNGAFQLTADAMDAWVDWYMNMEKTNPKMPPTFEGYLNRRQTHLRKLLMILSASRSNDMIINVDDFTRALDLLQRTERKMPRTFAGMGSSRNSQTITILHEYISEKGRVTIKELYSDLYGHVESPQQFQQLLSMLITQGFCKTEKAGNDTFIVYQKNNKLNTQYGQQP